MYSNNIDVDFQGNTVDIPQHDGVSEGLKLGGTLITATAADLNGLDNVVGNITIAYTASATTDGIEVTYTVVDGAAAAITAVHFLEITITDVDTGIGITGTSASGALTIVTGTQLEAVTAKKHLRCQTDVNGVLTVKLVDSANTAGEYFCVRNPLNGKVIIGAATVAGDYEGG